MRLRTLVTCTARLGLAVVASLMLGVNQAPGDGPTQPAQAPAKPAKVAAPVFRDVAEVLALGDAPRILQFRIDAEGTTHLRWRLTKAGATWQVAGPWSLSLTGGEAAYAALRAMKQTVLVASPERPEEDDPISDKSPRVVFDVEPTTPWGLVEWAHVVVSSEPNYVRRLTYMVGAGSAPQTIDPPKERYSDHPAAEVSIKLFRWDTDRGLDRAWTRIRWGEHRTWDIEPVHGQPADVVYRELQEAIVARIQELHSEDPQAVLPVTIATLPPTGEHLPSGDVFRAILVARRAGVTKLELADRVQPPGDGPSRIGAEWDLLPEAK